MFLKMFCSVTLLLSLPLIGWVQSITVIENPVNGTIGQSAYLLVVVAFPADYDLEWRFGPPTTGKLVVTDSSTSTSPTYTDDYRPRAELFRNNGTLRLDSLRSGDSGNYAVTVTNLTGGSGAAVSQTIQLQLFSGGPSIGVTVLKDPINGTQGQSAYLLVEVIYPSPTYQLTWRFGQTLVARDTSASVVYFGGYDGRSELSMRNGTLRLDNLKLEDRGNYTVTILDSGGKEEIGTLVLQVYVPLSKPTVTITTDVIKEGDSITLTCNIADGTDTVFSWYKDGNSITCSGSDTVCSENSPELCITSAKESDEGTYSCSVENPVSNNASDAVAFKVFVNVSKPSITVTPYPAKEGDDVTLNCTITKGNHLSYSWYINSSIVNCNGRYECNNESSQLIIRSAEPGDRGNYSCTGMNFVSTDTSDVTELKVYYGPSDLKLSIPASPCPDAWLNWFKVHNSLCVKESSNLAMSCEAQSLPTSNYTWLYNDTETLSSASVLVIDNFNSTNNGKYTCTASNDVTGKEGSDSRNLITYREPNDIRPRFSVSEPKDNQVIVSCSWRNALPQTWITLQVGNDWENGTEEVNKTVGENTLLSCTGYHLFNNDSVSLSTEKPKPVNTPPDSTPVPDGGPLTLTVTLGHSGAKHGNRQSQNVEILPATFSWTNPNNQMIDHNPAAGIRINSTNHSSELAIDKVTGSDGGKYTCEAKNIFGKTMISFMVDIKPVVKGPDVGLIVGATIGAIAGAVLIGVAIYFIVKSTNKKVQYHEEEKRDTANGNAGLPVDVYAVVNKPKTTNKEDNNSIALQDTSKPKESKSGDNELHYAELPVLQTQSFKFPRVDASNTIYSQIKTNN